MSMNNHNKKERAKSQFDPVVEGKEEDRGRTLPSGAPVEFSPKVETARVSERDGKIDRRRTGGSREGEKHIKRQMHRDKH